MKRFIAVLVLVVFALLSLVGCSSQTYEDVLNEYTQKLQSAAPTLLDEFKTESEGITDVVKLVELSNEKITKLAEISTEGVEKMAEIKIANSDDTAVYEEWAKKLTEVYEAQAKTISDECETVSKSMMGF